MRLRNHAFPFASKQSAYDTKSIHIALVFVFYNENRSILTITHLYSATQQQISIYVSIGFG